MTPEVEAAWEALDDALADGDVLSSRVALAALAAELAQSDTGPADPTDAAWRALDMARASGDRSAVLRAIDALAESLRTRRRPRSDWADVHAIASRVADEHGCLPQWAARNQWRVVRACVLVRGWVAHTVHLGGRMRPAVVYAPPGDPPSPEAARAARDKMRAEVEKATSGR